LVTGSQSVVMELNDEDGRVTLGIFAIAITSLPAIPMITNIYSELNEIHKQNNNFDEKPLYI